MGFVENENKNKTYAYVLSDGLIRVKSEEGVEKAIKRDYETPTGDKGTKWELVYAKLEGFINRIGFKDNEFGKFLEVDFRNSAIELDPDEKISCLSLDVTNSFAQDLMKKLPNVNLEGFVSLVPYSLESKKTGKTLKGITVYQDNKKIEGFFYDKIEKVNINGFPEVDQEKAKTYDKDDWKIYFLSVKKFLVKYTEDNIIPKVVTIGSESEATVEGEPTLEDVEKATVEKAEAVKEVPAEPVAENPAEKFEGAPFHTATEKEEMLTVIAEMAKAKFPNIKNPEDVKEAVMQGTNLAFIDANLSLVIDALDKIPNIDK